MAKFLDENGIKYLWSKISMEDYPNNETLIAILNAIDETKADKTELDNYLTKKEYEENGGTSTPDTPQEEAIITEYVYTYDGDTNSENNTWISNYGGTKVFVKMGEVPKGTLNLVGSTIFRTNPSNQWLDRTFTITQEHLDKVLNKASTDIPATQEGLI